MGLYLFHFCLSSASTATAILYSPVILYLPSFPSVFHLFFPLHRPLILIFFLIFFTPFRFAVRAVRPTGSKDSAPPSPDRKSNGRTTTSTNGTSSAKKTTTGSGTGSGSVSGEKGGLGDKSRDRRRGTDRKEGDRKEGDRARVPEGERRDRGGRERAPNSKVRRRFLALVTFIYLFLLLHSFPYLLP